MAYTGEDLPSFLEYRIYTFTTTPLLRLHLYFNMTLDLDPADQMMYDLQIDDGEITSHRLVPEPQRKGELPDGWYFAVQDCVWKRDHGLDGLALHAGVHVIRIRLRHDNMILEKLVVNLGGLKDSYLGPNPSYWVGQVEGDSNELEIL